MGMQDHTMFGQLQYEHGAEAGRDKDLGTPIVTPSEKARWVYVLSLTWRHPGPDIRITAIAARPGAVDSA